MLNKNYVNHSAVIIIIIIIIITIIMHTMMSYCVFLAVNLLSITPNV